MRVSLGEWQEGVGKVVLGVDFDRELGGPPTMPASPVSPVNE